MTAGLLAVGVSSLWLIMSVVFGRRAFRQGRADYLDRWHMLAHEELTQERARSEGLDQAYKMIYGWPAELVGSVFEWLITTEHLFGVPDSETDPWQQHCLDLPPFADPVDDLQQQLDEEERRQRGGAPAPCPCGYRHECVIHCGPGAECHEPEKHEVIITDHPERIKPRPVMWQDPGPEIRSDEHGTYAVWPKGYDQQRGAYKITYADGSTWWIGPGVRYQR